MILPEIAPHMRNELSFQAYTVFGNHANIP